VAPSGANLIWSENKEAMLFGVLASLVAILGGIMNGLDYVILIGAVSFMLFSFVMCLTLFGYYLNFKRKNSQEGLLSERVEQLSRKLEALSAKGLHSPSQGLTPAQGKDRELEQKVDELRILVKSLARAVDGKTERQPEKRSGLT
jgi:5-bromo-4-chloroindolyl phosphate hydrolysis protein